jgi:hypothetical protein
MKTIDATLSNFLAENGLNYEWRKTEHSGCWGKSCEGQHLVWELNIWRGDYRNVSWSFEEGCSTGMIIDRLTDRLKL